MSSLNILNKSHLFQGLDENSLHLIFERCGSISHCSKETYLFHEGDIGEYFYILLKGKVQISRSSADGSLVVLKTILPFESFAEVILFENNKYPSTAFTLEDCSLFKINKFSFIQILFNEKIALSFIANLMRKLRYLTQKIELLNNADVSERFFHFLESHYEKKENITIQESKKEIAYSIGTIPETLSRTLLKLKTKGIIISWKKNQLILKQGFWEERSHN